MKMLKAIVVVMLFVNAGNVFAEVQVGSVDCKKMRKGVINEEMQKKPEPESNSAAPGRTPAKAEGIRS
jgi:hypothetical protein